VAAAIAAMTMVVVAFCFASAAAAAEKKQEEKDGNGGEMLSEPMSPIIFVFIFKSKEVLLVDWVCVVTCYVKLFELGVSFTRFHNVERLFLANWLSNFWSVTQMFRCRMDCSLAHS
jgi:hypothetical protein